MPREAPAHYPARMASLSSSSPPRDLSNKALRHALGGAAALAALGLAALFLLPESLARPGSPLLQSLAIAGALLLLASFAAAMRKRLGGPGREGVSRHVMLACIGFALVATHTTGTVTKMPSTLLVILVLLMALGAWARTEGARRMSATFGTKPAGFRPQDEETRGKLKALIAEKRSLLTGLEPGANEGTFSPGVRHWLRAPLATLAYRRAMARESALVGAREPLSTAQARWRLAHQLLAWAFVIGLLIHVVVVTFFAGYAAEGREIYWWHVTDWDL